MLWLNMIGRFLQPSLQSEICPPSYSWDLDTTLLRTRVNSAANQRSHIEPGKSDVQVFLIVILAGVIQSCLPTSPNNLQSTYLSGMSDFRDIVAFCASAELSETLRSSLSPCPPAAPVSSLGLETLNCNFKAVSQNLIYANSDRRKQSRRWLEWPEICAF